MTKPRGRHSVQQQTHAPQLRKPEDSRVTSQWLDTGILISLLLASMALSAGVLQTQFYALMPTAGQAGVRAFVSVLFYGLVALALSYIAYRHHESFSKRYRLRASAADKEQNASAFVKFFQTFLVVAGLLFATRILALAWTGLTSYLGWQPAGAKGLLDMFGSSTLGVVLSFVHVIVVAPFVEELIFRGVLQEWLGTKVPVFVAIFLSASAFALYHLSLWALVPNLILGFACGYLAHKYATLWPAIILHMLYNATLFAAVLLVR